MGDVSVKDWVIGEDKSNERGKAVKVLELLIERENGVKGERLPKTTV